MPTVPEIITESILKQLEQGVAPWRKPWSTSVPRNLISKKPYRGLNVFLLATQGHGITNTCCRPSVMVNGSGGTSSTE